MQKRIIIIAPKTNGGITKVVENLLKGGLANNNLIFHPSTFESFGFKKIYLFIWQLIKSIILFISFKPDLIHIHVSSHGSFYRKSFYVILSKIFRKKLIIHIHPTHFIDFINNSGKIKKLFIIQILNKADLIITLTNQMKYQLKDIYKFKCNMEVVCNSIYLNDYKFHDIKNRDKNTILYLGSIIEKKGVYDLLLAAPLIKEKINDFRLIYCGNKETEKLRKMVVNSGLSEYIQVKDWVDSEEKRSLIEKATLLILPSYTEGIPNVILEAMASGIPIITTPVGGIPSLLKNNINCIYFSPGNIKQMVEKITYLLNHKEIQERNIKKNIELVKKYDARLILNNLQKNYDKI